MNVQHITISRNEKLTLIGNLSTMLSSGIPLLEAVETLLEDAKGNQKKLLLVLKEDLIQGKHINESFARFPDIFDKVQINIIKAAEEAGTLDVVLKDLRLGIRKDMEFNDKVRSALVYPIFVVFVFIMVFVMILVVVVPKISTVFLSLNIELPLPTVIIMGMSQILLTYTLPLIGGCITIILGIVYFYKHNKRRFFELFSSFPLVSKLVEEIDLTRFSRSMYILLSSGIPIVSSLELAENVVLRKDVRAAIIKCKEYVLSGKRLSEGFKTYKKIFPPLMIRITEAGERSGSLDKSMLEVSEFFDYQVSKTFGTLTALLEPILLVCIGGLIGGVMLAIIAPIYSLIGQIGSR